MILFILVIGIGCENYFFLVLVMFQYYLVGVVIFGLNIYGDD